MKITIVGTGYVGLVTGTSLASFGHKVICVDNDPNKVALVNRGESPFYERGVTELLKKVIKNGSFKVTTDLETSILNSDVTFIAVGTPTTNNRIDLSYIKSASEQVGKALKKVKKYHLVAVKSTVLPGTTENVVKPILEKYSGKKAGNFGLCMNPEFLREGTALEDALDPDRVVIGQLDAKSGKTFAKIYAKVNCPKVFVNLSTAEMTKYAANSLLATLISYSNEIARIAEHTPGVDVLDVWQGVHLDKRWSPIVGKQRIRPGVLNYIFSGAGYGGSCFPKDTKALAGFAEDLGVETPLVNSVISINHTQPHRTVWHLKKALGKNLKGKKIAVLGVAFKPDTDDTRESAAFPIIEMLIKAKAKVFSHDPEVYKRSIPAELKGLPIKIAKTELEAIKGADAVIVVTAWNQYKKLSPQFFKKNMKRPVVVDGRRIYDKNKFLKTGIIYKGIGL